MTKLELLWICDCRCEKETVFEQRPNRSKGVTFPSITEFLELLRFCAHTPEYDAVLFPNSNR